jgi:uncharacterized membrane protein (DUF4010 family)
MLGENFALLSIALLGVLITFLNWQSIRSNQGAELTTSAALLVTGLAGVTCGMGHTITPAAITVVVAGLLAWKERLAVFSQKLSAEELRSAILLAILTFAIYPLLPDHAVDPWGFFVPREAWITVILIAAIGFVNYILWKLFGDNGIELTGFLGGLVNSTVVVTELATRVGGNESALQEVAYRGILLATAAMAFRNFILLGILAPTALAASLIPLALILIPCAVLVLVSKRNCTSSLNQGPSIPLKSPFSIYSALKFGFYFLLLQILGTVARDFLGHTGFYAVSIVGGLLSSASAVASAGVLLTHNLISSQVAGAGAVLASLASAAVNLILVLRLSDSQALKGKLSRSLGVIIALAVVGAFLESQLNL